MYGIIFVFILALLPAFFSLRFVQRSHRRFQRRLARIRQTEALEAVIVSDLSFSSSESDEAPFFIGDRTCFYNALSPYLRCAVNPDGPCEGCTRYESRAGRALTK